MFMGFGYNPTLTVYGERLDMFDFFGWMRRLEDRGVKEWTIWDASGFQIVNIGRLRKIQELSERTGKKILEVLIGEQDLPKRREFRENSDKRREYLNRLIQISEINGTYLDAREVWRNDPRYGEAFEEALEITAQFRRDYPDLVRNIIPQKADELSELYLPLEIAEAIYLREVYNIKGKFGPETEVWFDKAVLNVCERKNEAYTTIRCPRGPRNAAYLAGREVITVNMSDVLIERTLSSDRVYREYIESCLEPFRKEGEKKEEITKRIKDTLRVDRQ